MLSILGQANTRQRFCNGLTPRDVLRIGGMALGGLTLPQVLRAEAQAGIKRSHKSVIMIYLCGGPPHQDMYDIKVDAPVEIRGPFRAIPTNVPGIQIGEHLPRIAGMMDKLVPIRSMVGARDAHYSYQCMTGHHEQEVPAGGWPHFGSVASEFLGAVRPGSPPYVSLCYTTQHRPYNEPGPGFLGLGHAPFSPKGPGRSDLILQGITADRLDSRRDLLRSFDTFRRQSDASGKMEGMDVFTERAMGILTSPEFIQCAGSIQGASPHARTLRYGGRKPADGGRCAASAAEPARGAAAGRGRGAGRDHQLQLLGLARRKFQERRERTARVRQGVHRFG